MNAAPAAPGPVQTRFGRLDIRPEEIISFPDGLPGFAQCRRFVLLSSPELAPIRGLQGLDGSRPGFLAIDPRLVRPDYDTGLTEADRRRLGAEVDEPLVWLALVRTEATRVLVDLRSPIVVNPRRMLGLQVVAADSPYSMHHPLLSG